MTLAINNQGGSCTIQLTEDLTIFEVSQYHQTLLSECNFKDKITLDFSHLEDIDTAGLQLVLSLEKQVKQAGGQVFLQASNPEINKQLEIFNLLQNFKPLEEGQ